MSRSGGLRVFGMVLVLGLSASGAGAEEHDRVNLALNKEWGAAA